MMKSFFFLIICNIVSSCIVDIGKNLVNELDEWRDVYEYIPITVSISDITIEEEVFVQLELATTIIDRDIKRYPDSQYPRLKYRIAIFGAVLPSIRINSFYFTCEKDKDTIPCILYYRDKNDFIVIIENFPVVFTNEIREEMLHDRFQIFVECRQSYYNTDKIHINYDIEVGDRRYVKKIKYRRKFYMDWRPKLW